MPYVALKNQNLMLFTPLNSTKTELSTVFQIMPLKAVIIVHTLHPENLRH